MKDYFLIAKITSSHGRNGAVKIISSFDFKEIFFKLDKIFVDFFGDKKLLRVENIEEGNDCFFLKIKNFNSETDSKILIGKSIFVDKNDLLELPEDHFFVHDLIGSIVFCNDEKIGMIKDVLKFPANDVYVILDMNNLERLIPAVPEFLDKFDPKKKILTLKKLDEYYEEDEDDED